MAKRVKNSIQKQNSGECSIADDEQVCSRQINPLFVEVIMENILSYLKEKNKSISLGAYRLVCKFWEQEIIKMIRRETHVKIHRILKPYPEGYGWTPMKGANKFLYNLPYSQVPPFQNIEVVVLDRQLSYVIHQLPDEKLEIWFKLMGYQVKSLIFSCSLKSSELDNYRILERILKEWCPNLERLALKDIQLMEGLVFTSFFEDPTKEIICKKLNELTIDFNRNEDFKWPKPNGIPNIVLDPSPLNQFIYNHNLPCSNEDFPEISNASGEKVNIPKDYFTTNTLPDLSKLIPEKFFPKYFDGGILGQLMKHTNVKKLRLEGSLKPINREHLVAFFHYRANNWKTCLKRLEIYWRNLSKELVVLGRVKFPVVLLKLTTATFETFQTKSEDMTRFLSCFAETLAHLQFAVLDDESRSIKLILPFLPKLKTFVLDKVNVYQLSAFNLVTNTPNLETCHLKGHRNYRDQCGNIDTFFEGSYCTKSNNKLRDFRLIGENVCFSGVQASSIFEWFPNVKRIELIGIMDDKSGRTRLLHKLRSSEVINFKMSWSKIGNTSIRNNIIEDTALIQKIGKLQNLNALEITYDNEKLPFHVMPIAFQDGFGKLSTLRFLKLKNFGVNLDEKQEVLGYMNHIPVVQIFKMANLRRASTRPKRIK